MKLDDDHSSHDKQAQTVLGLVNAQALGVTLPHEHLLIDMTVWFSESDDESLRKKAYEPVTMENLSWITYNQYNNLDNVRLLDEQMAIDEAMHFKNEGGSTIVDVTTRGLTPNPPALRRIAQATGLNIIAGTGHYVLHGDEAQAFDRMSIDQIATLLITDITQGMNGTDIRAGIIGEIGCSWPLNEREKKSLTAAAMAQQATGAAITIHPGRGYESPMEILRTLKDAGADLTRVVMGHLDRTGFPVNILNQIAQTGCYLEYDIFGGNPFYPLRFGVFDRPCDRERIEQIQYLTKQGHLHQILISQDVCLKSKLTRFGGPGYAHIQRNIIPQMIARGMNQNQIDTIMVNNPRKLLCFAGKTQ